MIRKLRKTNLYYIQGDIGSPVKIGISGNVSQRLSELQVSHWEKLNVILIVKGCYSSLERHLHSLYENERCRGEWFDSCILEHFVGCPDLFRGYGIYDEIQLFGYYEKIVNDARIVMEENKKMNLRNHWLKSIITDKELICELSD